MIATGCAPQRMRRPALADALHRRVSDILAKAECSLIERLGQTTIAQIEPD
ncbi:MAG: hypothetical protein AAF667_06865 [Pseudomonadota bacterium]